MHPRYPTDLELHAFIDDELEPRRHAEIAAILNENEPLASRVAAWQADRELLRQSLNEILEEPLPAAWVERIKATLAAPPPLTARFIPKVVPRVVMTRRFALAASVAVAASAGALVRWRWSGGETILTEAEAARGGHLEGRLAADDPLPPPATREALLQSTLGMRVRAPELERFGFHLARMELFNRPGGGAAQLRYSDLEQRALTIYVRPSDGKVQFDILHRGDTLVCVWQDDVVGAVITARVSAAEMLRIASSAYTSLNL